MVRSVMAHSAVMLDAWCKLMLLYYLLQDPFCQRLTLTYQKQCVLGWPKSCFCMLPVLAHTTAAHPLKKKVLLMGIKFLCNSIPGSLLLGFI